MALKQMSTSPAEDSVPGLPDVPGTPKSILVAEDEHLLARSLSTDLVELGYTVVGPAPNGQVAVELARLHRPDMALLDIRMPVMDGLAAGQVLYAQMGIPVVILSAYSDPPYLQAGARLGVFGYLLKPVSLDELRVTLTVSWSRFLEQRKLSGEVQDLKVKLEHRKIIEKAKGLLMRNMGITEEEAMRALQKQARDSRRPMVELAKAILDTQGLVEKVDRTKASGGAGGSGVGH
jgi:response regulator NasT